MTQIRLAFWMAAFLTIGQTTIAQQLQPGPPIAATPQLPPTVPVSQSPSVNAGQTPSSGLADLEAKVRPAVIWVTTFDSKGNLLRTESGFFISAEGRFVTTEHATEGAVNGVAKTGDGGIYDVTGILAASKALDLAVLQADIKPRKLLRFLDLNKTGELSAGASVTVVGSALAGNEGSAHETTITARSSDRLEIAGAIPASSVGAPVVNENGDVVGAVTSAGEKAIARPVTALDSLLSAVTADTQPHWPEVAKARPTPQATPQATPRPRLIYAPAPSFPSGQSLSGQSGTGRFLLTFDARGNVTDIKIVTSTGNPYFDQAAVKTLRQWKSAPSQGWQATVPVTFRTR
jgi:TonB family protein